MKKKNEYEKLSAEYAKLRADFKVHAQEQIDAYEKEPSKLNHIGKMAAEMALALAECNEKSMTFFAFIEHIAQDFETSDAENMVLIRDFVITFKEKKK